MSFCNSDETSHTPHTSHFAAFLHLLCFLSFVCFLSVNFARLFWSEPTAWWPPSHPINLKKNVVQRVLTPMFTIINLFFCRLLSRKSFHHYFLKADRNTFLSDRIICFSRAPWIPNSLIRIMFWRSTMWSFALACPQKCKIKKNVFLQTFCHFKMLICFKMCCFMWTYGIFMGVIHHFFHTF